MKGGRIAAEWLKAQGVTHVFALCGEHVLPLLDSCEEIGIRVIGTRLMPSRRALPRGAS
jgi:acetolactate synthase-1/2/3 large subunit